MSRKPLQLRCIDGHVEVATFSILQVAENGFWMWTPCDFGYGANGHWLAPDQERGLSHIVVQPTPHEWRSAGAAWLAHENWE